MREITREARLRPEHASHYPMLRAGEWHPAHELSSRVRRRVPARSGADGAGDRTLDGRHFEFRGGLPRGREAALRTREEDPELF